MIAWECPAPRLVTFLLRPAPTLHVNARQEVMAEPHVLKSHEVREISNPAVPLLDTLPENWQPYFYCVHCRQHGRAVEWELQPGIVVQQAKAAVNGEKPAGE